MKKIVTLGTAAGALLIAFSLCFAQTPGEMKQKDMMADMSAIMNDISGIMGTMSGMAKDASPENTKKMSGIVRSLSQEMTNLSNMMETGRMSDRELEMMRVRVLKTQQMMNMEMKK